MLGEFAVGDCSTPKRTKTECRTSPPSDVPYLHNSTGHMTSGPGQLASTQKNTARAHMPARYTTTKLSRFDDWLV
jgi:hypothetical protein